MGSIARAHLRRLHLAVAGAVVLAALTTGGTREAVADEGFRGYLRDPSGMPGAVRSQAFGINDSTRPG